MLQAVTIDFHDTLFQCDDWFELEVRELPARFLRWLEDCQPGSTRIPPMTDVERIYRSLRHNAIESGIEVDSIDCVARVCEEIDVAVERDIIIEGVGALMRAALTTAEPRPGVIETVETLGQAGLKLGIISNAIHHDFLEWSLDRFQMSDHFDLVLSSAKAGYYKSRVELYQHAIADLDVPANAIIHIGDSYRFDVVGASAAGMQTAWLNLTHASPGDVIPDITVSTMVGLGALVLDWDRSSRRPNQDSLHAV